MNRSLRRFLRRTAASILKRWYILTSNGFSVGSAYGARFLFDWRHPIDKKVAVELYEYEQIRYLLKMLDRIRPDLFLDIGAHAALYSILTKSHRPELEVHAFEPDRNNRCQLYGNLFINRLGSDITVHEHGISSTTGMASFDDSAATSSRGTRRISETGTSSIAVKRLDDVFSGRGRQVAIKIDVEGHELQVVEGARNFLANNRCLLQIESDGEQLVSLKQQLGDLGYRYLTSYSDHYFTNIDPLPERS
jgi:FkbM family methyltransferase